MKKLLFIINPKAGKIKIKNSLLSIIDLFCRSGYLVTAVTTQYGGHAGELAAKASGYDLLVCAGGDGTLNEVIGGVVSCGSDIPIGYIPCGSTNDFASCLGLANNPLKAAEDILSGVPRSLDVGQFGDRRFIYTASLGVFTSVSYDTPQNLKNMFGHLAYVLKSIEEIHDLRSEHLRFEVDGRVYEDDYIFCAVTNTTSLGGLLTFDSNVVDLSDGKFEILLVKKPDNLISLNKCILSLQNHKYDSECIVFDSGTEFKVFSRSEINWSLDGEMATAGKCTERKNIPNAVSIRLPVSKVGKPRIK